MRIDEFSNASSIDGSISTAEQTQFLLFGFDIGLAEPLEIFYELISIVSAITLSITMISELILDELTVNSPITFKLSLYSPLGGSNG